MRSPPLCHAGSKDTLCPAVWLGSNFFIKPVERLTGPELFIKPFGFPLRGPVEQHFLDDHRPGPERGQDQHHHHQFHRERRAREKPPHGEINLLRLGKNLCFHLPALLPVAVRATFIWPQVIADLRGKLWKLAQNRRYGLSFARISAGRRMGLPAVLMQTAMTLALKITSSPRITV